MIDQPAGVPVALSIPRVERFASDDWESAARAMRAGAGLDFKQAWLPREEPDFRPGRVWLGVQGDDLVAYAELEDDQPFNKATRWNEPTWTTGDALEFFFQAEGRPGYFEFHVTPENQRLQLFFPSQASFRAHRPFHTWTIAESRFESTVRIDAGRAGWRALMKVKLALVLDLPRADGAKRFRFLFSRYDYQPGRKLPIMAAAAPMTAPNFHNIKEWLWAEVSG